MLLVAELHSFEWQDDQRMLNDFVGIVKDLKESRYASEEPMPLHANSGMGDLEFPQHSSEMFQ